MGPTGPKGATGVKGEPVSIGKVFGGAEQVKVLPPLTFDPSTHRAHLAWFFLETLAPRETLETG